MKKFFAAIVISGLLAGLGIARAEPSCGASKVVLFGYVAGATVNPNAVKCLVDPGEARDGRILLPRSTEVSMRYAGDLSPPPSKLDGRLKGLGFGTTWIQLTRERINDGTPFGDWVYNSPRIAIPGGATAKGCLTGEIVFNKGTIYEYVLDSNRFHTYDAECT